MLTLKSKRLINKHTQINAGYFSLSLLFLMDLYNFFLLTNVIFNALRMNVARAFNIQYKEFHYFSFLVGRSLSNERTQISVRFYNYSIWYNELMLSQSRQHNYVYRHNIRPCPLLCSLLAIFFFSLFQSFFLFRPFTDLSFPYLRSFDFIFHNMFFCVSRRFTCTFFRLRFLSFSSHPVCVCVCTYVCLFVSAVAFGSCTQNIALI